MSYGAQTGVIAISPLVSKSTPAGSPKWYKFRATDIDFDAISPGGVLPPEIAGILTPTGAYKSGIFAAGGFSIIPRLDGDLGWLLYGLMGYVTSGSAAQGYTHTFKYPADQTELPWFEVRRVTPGDTDLYLDVMDCKVARARLTIPQAGPLAARVDLVGRSPTFPSGSSWTYETMDDSDAFPIANATGYFKMPDFDADALPVTGMVFEWMNLMTTPQEEMVVGSNYPDDFGVRGRAMTARFIYRWKDPDLYRRIFTGAVSGSTAWTPEVFTSDLEAKVTTPGNWLGTPASVPLSLVIKAEKVEFAPNGPVRLLGNQTIAVEYVGTVLTPDDETPYCQVVLANDVATYTWPAS